MLPSYVLDGYILHEENKFAYSLGECTSVEVFGRYNGTTLNYGLGELV